MTATLLQHPAATNQYADAMAVAKALSPEEGVFLFSASELTSRAQTIPRQFSGHSSLMQ